LQRELPKGAGADLQRPEIVSATTGQERLVARRVIDTSFTSAFHVVMLGTAGAALLAALSGMWLPSSRR
jgi:hypothetical protein